MRNTIPEIDGWLSIGGARRPRRAAVLATLALLLLAGCSGGKDPDARIDDGGDRQTVKQSNCQTEERVIPLRKEFVVVREIVRQHGLQQGNDNRMTAIETALKAKFPLLPDEGETEEEKRIYHDAKALYEQLK